MKTARVLLFLFLAFSAAKAVEAQCVPASTAAGAFDTCFDGDGKVTTDVGAHGDHAYAVAVQPDGKIVAAGVTYGFTSSISDGALVRYHPDGSLDSTFGGGDGIATSGLPRREIFYAVALQPDGKIVAAGMVEPTENIFSFAIMRFNANGSLDTSFGVGGTTVIDIPGTNDQAFALAIQSDGKIVAGGKRETGGAGDAIMARLNSNGSLDTSFDTDGWMFPNDMRTVRALALQADGKIVAAGSTSFGLGAVARMNANGTPDTFFGNNGLVIYSFSNLADAANGLQIRFDGNIFVGGATLYNQMNCGALLGFETNGAVGPNMVTCDEVYFTATAMQADSKIVTAGWSRSPNWEFAVGRYINAAAVDTTFGTLGKVIVQFTPGGTNESLSVAAIATGRDNKIVVAGGTTVIGSFNSRFAIARLMSGLQPPHAERFDFDGDGKADVSVYRHSERRWYVFRSSDSGVTERVFGEGPYAPVPADYDGDGKTDFGLFSANINDEWRYVSSLSDNTVGFSQFAGTAGDIPRPSDFDGDGKTDYVVYRPSQNFWYRTNASGISSNGQFGASGDKPVTGDFDGDGKSDKAIFRPSTGDWWYQSSINNAQLAVHWGIPTDVPAAADYDGDGKTDFAVYRPETGVWYIINSSNFSFTILNFGIAEDKPVPADYDGDGKSDVAVFRPSTGVWYLLRSSAGFAAMQFGVSTDVPLPGVYIN